MKYIFSLLITTFCLSSVGLRSSDTNNNSLAASDPIAVSFLGTEIEWCFKFPRTTPCFIFTQENSDLKYCATDVRFSPQKEAWDALLEYHVKLAYDRVDMTYFNLLQNNSMLFIGIMAKDKPKFIAEMLFDRTIVTKISYFPSSCVEVLYKPKEQPQQIRAYRLQFDEKNE